MVAIVIPAKNEENRIAKVLDTCSFLAADIIIVVINGCIDQTKNKILGHPLLHKIKLIRYSTPLGIDIPRAIGAAYAYKIGSNVIMFLDGDMIGNIANNLNKLIYAVQNDGIDMALTNCYPYINYRHPLASTVSKYREKLNKEIGLFPNLGISTPSHGPHAISRKLLQLIPFYSLAIPPLSLAIAAQKGLYIKVVTSIDHKLLLSSERNQKHSDLIAQTIIGDCLQAINYIDNNPYSNNSRDLYLGYHPTRRFDLLEKYLHHLNLPMK
ncbi:Glycosyl transferase family 2 [Desulfonispora thiosulfatigenes DSM 11270]|uniref:Glycosyl transferase family 2 n=1 Tax=Desulfonispora thiosulfatigenes DSM 11270 TaxID=656914 RepID=A0A1W1V0L4_DESTI|nr:glycosyltransferase [Desulfonispora thiosulfatigenes]SMB86840.1 Glycosyl transferase family 2 [Desulfonispora thiosulfatigenes DSM 11270]